MVRKIIYIQIILFIIILHPITGQNENSAPEQPLPQGFDEISFGMTVQEVKEKLKNSRNFFYREAEVTLTPDREKKVIEAEGLSFLQDGIFQFRDEKLYIIILHIEKEKIGYFTMYKTLTEKYGEPDRLSPEESEWESETVILILEKPVTVKYVYKPVYQEILHESGVEESLEALTRNNFLEQF